VFNIFLAFLLGFVKNKSHLDERLFRAVARLSITVAVEAVALRVVKGNKLQVFLRRRDFDNPNYPGQWHIPDNIMLPGEEIEDVLFRLHDEFGSEVSILKFVGNFNNTQERCDHFFYANIFGGVKK